MKSPIIRHEKVCSNVIEVLISTTDVALKLIVVDKSALYYHVCAIYTIVSPI